MYRISIFILSIWLIACSNDNSYGFSSKTPRFAYVVNNGSNNIAAYSVNSKTGALTQLGETYVTGAYPSTITLSPDNKFIYVTNTGLDSKNGSVSIFSVNSATGALTATGYDTPVGAYPYGIALNHKGIAFVANYGLNAVSSYKLDETAGGMAAASILYGVGSGPFFIAENPARNALYAISNYENIIYAFDVNLTNGVLTAVPGSPVATGSGPTSVAVSPNGKLVFVTNYNDDTISVYSVDYSGSLKEVPGSPFWTGASPNSIAVNPNGQYVYVTNWRANTIQSYSVNSNGGLNAVGAAVATGDNPFPATVDPSGRFVYVPNKSSASASTYCINQNTGELTALGSPVATGEEPAAIAVLAD